MRTASVSAPFVLRYVYAILAVFAIAVVILFTALQVTHERELTTRNEIEFIHLDSITELEELGREARALQQRVRDSLASEESDQTGAAGIESVQLGYGGLLEVMRGRLSKLAQLEEQSSDEIFTRTVDRLISRFGQIERTLRHSTPTDETVTAIEILNINIEQYDRLHQIAADRLLNELAQRQSEEPRFIGFLVMCLGLGALAIVLLVRRLGRSLQREVQTELALIESQERLHHIQKLDAIGGLAGGVAHDFNNWLTVILGHVGLLRDSADNDDRGAASLDEIDQAAQQAVLLTKQLLSFSRRQQFQPQILNLNELIRSMEEMLHRVLSANIKLNFAYADDLFDVELDPDQMQQVILNLVNNARDAMPGGGELSVTTRKIFTTADHDGIPGLPDGDYALLSVADSGTGMDEETRQRLFEPFYTTKDRGQGTGLGLSTAHGIVTASNGHIFVSSGEGDGSRFDLYFPRTERSEPKAGSEQQQQAPHTGVETILVVEDNDQVREFLEIGLASLGYRILSAAGGAAGLDLCRQERGPIDVILSDVVMPEMSGPEFLHAALEVRPDAAAIYMSAYAKNEVLRLRSENEATDIPLITKPFGIEQLSRLIRERLDRRTDS